MRRLHSEKSNNISRLNAGISSGWRLLTQLRSRTGARKGELLQLRWSQIDLEARTVHLEPGTTKNGQGRTIPLTEQLVELLKAQKVARQLHSPNCEYVFCRKGKRIGNFQRAWKSACGRAGLVGRLFHDLRRSAVRNMVRASVPERVAMAISGHKTRAVFDRYNIVAERDLHDGDNLIEEVDALRGG